MLTLALPHLVVGSGGRKREGFVSGWDVSTALIISNLVGLILTVIAIYVCFTRNPQFALGPFLAAFCLPLCYIIYAVAVPATAAG